MSVRSSAHSMKLMAPYVANMPLEKRNSVLLSMAAELEKHKDEIFAANAEDMARAEAEGLDGAVTKRLRFDEGKLSAVIQGLKDLASLPDPIGHIDIKRELDEGLLLERISCPIGVIGVIFEARPDALVQISSLCLKSGNAAILKGGRETI